MKGDFRSSFAVASPTEENSRLLDPFFPPLTWNLMGEEIRSNYQA